MSEALETIIGARLQVIDEGAIASLSEFNDELSDTADIMAAASKSATKMAAAFTKVAAAQDKQSESAKANADANKEAADANAENASTSQKTQKALVDETAIVDGATVSHVKLAKAVTNTTKATSSLGDKVVSLGSGALGKVGKYTLIAGVAEAYETIKKYTSVQAAMTKLMTMAGVPKNAMPTVTQEALDLSKKYGISMTDMANATYRLASASVKAKHPVKTLLTLMPAFAQAATTLQSAPGAQTESLARMFGAFQKGSQSGLQGVGSPQHVAAMLTAMAGAGDIQGTDLQSALGKGIILQGAALKLKAKDLMAYVDLATQYGQGPSTAGTLVSHALAMISNPSAQGQKTEEMFGIDQGTMRQIASTKGVPAAVSYFNQMVQNGLHPTASLAPTSTIVNGKRVYGDQGTMASAAYQLINWGVSIPTAQKLLSGQKLTGQQETSLYNLVVGKSFGGGKQESTFLAAGNNPKLYAAYASYIAGNSTKKQFDNKLAQTLNTPAYQEKVARNDLSLFQYNVGKDITPAWLNFLHAMEDVAKWLGNNSAALKALLGTVGGVLGLGVAAYVGKKAVNLYRDIGKAVSSVGRLFNLGDKAGNTAETVEMGDVTTTLDAAASALLTAGESLQVAADRLMGNGIGGGLGGGVEGVEGAGEEGAEGAGALGAGKRMAGITGGESLTTGIGEDAGATFAGPALFAAAAPAAALAAVGGVAYVAARYGNTVTNAVDSALQKIPGLNSLLPTGNIGQTGVKNGKPTYGPWLPSQIPTPKNTSGLYPSTTGKGGPGYYNKAGLKAHNQQVAFDKHLDSIKNQTHSIFGSTAESMSEKLKYGYGQSVGKQAKSTENQANSQAGKDLSAAAKETQQAQKDTQKASTETGQAATKSQTAASQLNAAAKAHKDAASSLEKAAAALQTAIGQIDAGQITANKLAQVVAGLANKGNANSAARGK